MLAQTETSERRAQKRRNRFTHGRLNHSMTSKHSLNASSASTPSKLPTPRTPPAVPTAPAPARPEDFAFVLTLVKKDKLQEKKQNHQKQMEPCKVDLLIVVSC